MKPLQGRQTVAIAGGSGFIGSACARVLDKRYEVRLIPAPRFRAEARPLVALREAIELREVEQFQFWLRPTSLLATTLTRLSYTGRWRELIASSSGRTGMHWWTGPSLGSLKTGRLDRCGRAAPHKTDSLLKV